jgi:hypothetical protein
MIGWENFFIAEFGASAVLTGLIFVGVSINLTRILSIPGLANRALLALTLLLAILVVSSLLLVPGQSLLLVGIDVLLTGLAAWTIVWMLDISILRSMESRYRRPYVINMVLSQLAVLLYIIAGITVLVSGAGGLYWLVPAIILSFIKAILDAWVLLIEINR